MRAAVGAGVAAMLLLGLVAVPVHAHHSAAMFDFTRRITITGTVTEFAWVNPHAILRLDVPAADAAATATHYTIETASPSKLSDSGWKFNDLKPGDRIVLVIYPLRDGRPGGTFIKATFADGRVLGVNFINDELPPLKVLPR